MQNELFLKHYDYNKSLLKILLDFLKVKIRFCSSELGNSC